MSDNVLISCSFSVVSVSVLTLVLISCACTQQTQLSRGGQNYVSVGWGMLQVPYQVLHADLFCGTRTQNALCLTFVLSFTEGASGEMCLINLNFSLKSFMSHWRGPKCAFKSTAQLIEVCDVFDSSNTVSWDLIPDMDVRKFNSTSKNWISLTQGGQMKRTLALLSCLTLFFLLFLGFLLLLLNIITISFEKWLIPKSKNQVVISFVCDAVLFELNKTRCCLARMCALVHLLFAWTCMLSFAKVFPFLILRLVGK